VGVKDIVPDRPDVPLENSAPPDQTFKCCKHFFVRQRLPFKQKRIHEFPCLKRQFRMSPQEADQRGLGAIMSIELIAGDGHDELHVEVAHRGGVGLDERLARRHVVAHQAAEDAVRGRGILDGHL
jgi:hypothetical protein